MTTPAAEDRGPDVCGAVASLMRLIDPDDPAYPGVRVAYWVALDAAGLGKHGTDAGSGLDREIVDGLAVSDVRGFVDAWDARR